MVDSCDTTEESTEETRQSDNLTTEKSKEAMDSGNPSPEISNETMNSENVKPEKSKETMNSENPTLENPKKMMNSEQRIPENSTKPSATEISQSTDVENPSSLTEISSVIKRWKREDLLKKASLLLRAATMFFSLLSFLIMASNKHGDWKDFDQYQEYRYCLAIAILAIIYSVAQVLYQVNRIWTGKDLISQRNVSVFGFLGDQILAYLLISSASAAIPLTNRMREGADNSFTDSSSTSISMSFLAFLTMSLSAIISGFKLSNQNYF